MAARTNAVSLRLSDAEKAKLKMVAERLDVRETDILRYAIEAALSRLGLLLDPQAGGVDLLPVFVETGSEMLRYFSIDSSQLDTIINAGVDDSERRVDARDLALIASASRNDPVAAVHLRARFGSGDENDDESIAALRQKFRDYLYQKYLYDRQNDDAHSLAMNI